MHNRGDVHVVEDEVVGVVGDDANYLCNGDVDDGDEVDDDDDGVDGAAHVLDDIHLNGNGDVDNDGGGADVDDLADEDHVDPDAADVGDDDFK